MIPSFFVKNDQAFVQQF